MSKQKQLVRTYVRSDLMDRFKAQFPGHGSISWLLEQAIVEVLAITDGQPALEELVRSAIRSAVLRERISTRAANAVPPNGVTLD